MDITSGGIQSIETIWRVQIKNILTQVLIEDGANRGNGRQPDHRSDYIDIHSLPIIIHCRDYHSLPIIIHYRLSFITDYHSLPIIIHYRLSFITDYH
jgi:hypothetical protein